MPLIHADRVKETSTTTGTGTYDLAGAATGFRTFVDGIATGNTCFYVAEDGTDWEVGIGTVTDATPDTLARTTILSSSNAGAAVSWGAGTKNLFCGIPATAFMDFSAIEGVRGTSGSLAATYDRATHSALATAGAATSGTLRLMRILLPKGMLVSNISFWSGTTALATATHQWFALFDISRNLLAISANDTSAAWAASSAKTLAMTTPYRTTYVGWHYIGYCIVATTVPTIESAPVTLTTGSRTAAPVAGGNSSTSLTTPASCPNPAGAISALGQFNYGEVS